MFTQHLYVMLAAVFAFGALASIRQVTGFVYFLELIPKKNNTAAACAFFVIDVIFVGARGAGPGSADGPQDQP